MPPHAHAFDQLASVAANLRDNRAAGDPKLVADGKLTAAQATTRLRIASAIAADWTADPLDLDDAIATPAEKVAALTAAIAVMTARADRARQAMIAEGAWLGRMAREELAALVAAHDSRTHRIRPWLDQSDYADTLHALLWWQHRRADGWRINPAVLPAPTAAETRRAA